VSSRRLILGVAFAAVLGGGLAAILGHEVAAKAAWSVATAIVAAPLLVEVARSLWRRDPGVDAIAFLAMASALAVGEFLAAGVVALMVSGGNALEEFAAARARRNLSALLDRSPRSAHRYERGELVEVEAAALSPGDRLLVKQGDVVPVDGVVASPFAVLDESALTGESIPVERASRDAVRSGVVNAGGPFELIATATAEGSTYAAMVRLAREADARKAPFARMADRYAGFFLPATVIAAGAAWALSGDPKRAVAVLVVATPCPMILAVPIALIGGISRGARRGIIVKGGRALEALSRARVLLMDKTGTITAGTARVSDVMPFDGHDPDELVRLAASLDQLSSHVFAPAIVREAQARRLPLATPELVSEVPGGGIRGTVDGRRVAVGKVAFVVPGAVPAAELRLVHRRTALDGSAAAYVAIEGRLAGALVLQDPIRPDAFRTIRQLRRAGLGRVILVTGDHSLVAEAVGAGVGVDEVFSGRSAAEKVDVVRAERARGPTVMVGDGVNDAAALAEADVGVALGAKGSSASSEAADVVILVDRLDRLAESIAIARRSMRIARQSLAMGMGLSLIAMVAAGLGYLPPVAGAVLQEGIDVAVIVNALRALGAGRARRREDSPDAARFEAEHRRLLPSLDRLRRVADQLDEITRDSARAQLEEVREFLEEQIIPHERREDAVLYPAVARTIGGLDPTAPMSRAHLEIAHLIHAYGRLVAEMDPAGPDAADRRDLRRILYGLHAVLALHFAQEDEHYLSLYEAPARAAETRVGG